VQLDEVRAQLLRHARRVVLRVEGPLAATGVDGPPPRIGPHHDRHAQPLAVLADLLEIADPHVFARRAHVQREADGVGAQPHRVLDARAEGRDGVAVVGDVGLAVELQDEGDPARVLLHVLVGQADPERDRGVVAFHGQAKLEVGIHGGGVRKEVGRPVFKSLIEGQDGQGAVARPVAVQHPPQPDPLAMRDGKAGQ
jgi:hypothetical protein